MARKTRKIRRSRSRKVRRVSRKRKSRSRRVSRKRKSRSRRVSRKIKSGGDGHLEDVAAALKQNREQIEEALGQIKMLEDDAHSQQLAYFGEAGEWPDKNVAGDDMKTWRDYNILNEQLKQLRLTSAKISLHAQQGV